VPFIVARACDRPELVGGEVLAGVHNIGKPIDEHRLLAALREVVEA
jgi:hypothetical protein